MTSSIARCFDPVAITRHKSAFLFGPRQTGKSWLIRHTLPDSLIYDLLDAEVYAALSSNPKLIEQQWLADKSKPLVVLDEVQRLPSLLNEVHRLIELHGIRFLLTGSSARKLRRSGVNLLGGRARLHHLFPFTSAELGNAFDLSLAVNRGLLPSIYASDAPDADLASYIGTYLREEIAAEAVARNVPAFSRFLQVAAACNGAVINHTRIANDAQVPRTTVIEYFEILKDTMLAYEVPAWRATVKRKALATSKLYLFDAGIARHLRRQNEIRAGSPEYGPAVETVLCHELWAYCGYTNSGSVAYWRSTSGFEVDFILADRAAIELKASANVATSDLKGLRALREEGLLKAYYCVTLEPRAREVDGILLLPISQFLKRLWAGQI